MNIKITDKTTGKQIDPAMIFLNAESDGGTASLLTTLSALSETYNIEVSAKSEATNL